MLRPGLGAVVALAPRPAQAQGVALSSRQVMDLGAEAAPAATERGIRRFLLGRARCAYVRAPDRAVGQHGGQIWIGLPVSHQARPDALIAPAGITAIDRIPFPVRGRQPPLGGARRRHPA